MNSILENVLKKIELNEMGPDRKNKEPISRRSIVKANKKANMDSLKEPEGAGTPDDYYTDEKGDMKKYPLKDWTTAQNTNSVYINRFTSFLRKLINKHGFGSSEYKDELSDKEIVAVIKECGFDGSTETKMIDFLKTIINNKKSIGYKDLLVGIKNFKIPTSGQYGTTSGLEGFSEIQNVYANNSSIVNKSTHRTSVITKDYSPAEIRKEIAEMNKKYGIDDPDQAHFENSAAHLRSVIVVKDKWIHINELQTDYFNKLKSQYTKFTEPEKVNDAKLLNVAKKVIDDIKSYGESGVKESVVREADAKANKELTVGQKIARRLKDRKFTPEETNLFNKSMEGTTIEAFQKRITGDSSAVVEYGKYIAAIEEFMGNVKPLNEISEIDEFIKKIAIWEDDVYKAAISELKRSNPRVEVFTSSTPDIAGKVHVTGSADKMYKFYNNFMQSVGFVLKPISYVKNLLIKKATTEQEKARVNEFFTGNEFWRNYANTDKLDSRFAKGGSADWLGEIEEDKNKWLEIINKCISSLIKMTDQNTITQHSKELLNKETAAVLPSRSGKNLPSLVYDFSKPANITVEDVKVILADLQNKKKILENVGGVTNLKAKFQGNPSGLKIFPLINQFRQNVGEKPLGGNDTSQEGLYSSDKLRPHFEVKNKDEKEGTIYFANRAMLNEDKVEKLVKNFLSEVLSYAKNVE